MQRATQEFARGSEFHDLSGIHHRHAIRDVAHDAKIVRDEKYRHAEALLEVAEQIQNLRLNRHIKRGGWLVGHEKFGSLANAIAIITRCCIPPDISNG